LNLMHSRPLYLATMGFGRTRTDDRLRVVPR
jgi:hypothetical protein